MQKTNFTSIRSLQFMFMSLLMMVGFNMSAQTLACNDAVQVSVNDTPNLCEVDLTADMFLEGDEDPNVNYFGLIKNGITVVNATSAFPINLSNTSQYFDDVLTVTVYAGDPNAGGAPVNSCWVNLTIEDKLAPVLTPTDVTIACTADADLVPACTAVDNCTPANQIDIQLVDEVTSTVDNCSGNGTAGFVTIVRTYIAVDAEGNTSATCQQVITVIRPDLVDIPDDLVWSCDQYAAHPHIINPSRIMPGIANGFGTTYPVFDNTGAWNLTSIPVNSFLLTANVPGTTNPTGSGVPSGIFDPVVGAPAPNNNANPLGGDLAADYCKYAYSEADQVLSTCGYAASTDEPVFKIVRTWTVLDWCTGNIATNLADADAVQIIKVIDVTAPIVSGADEEISANIPGQHPQACTGQGPIAMGTATDNCTGAENIQGFVYSDIALNSAVAQITEIGNTGFGILNPALPVGSYFIVWTAEDGCGNVGQSTTYTLDVIDDIVPVAVCDEITQVAVSSDGLAVVYAETFDDGSYDNCCLDRLEVRRMAQTCGINGNTTFDNDGDANDSNSDPDDGAFVTFCCSDIGNENMVVLRVWDCSDNYNECMVEVLVEDKLAPTIVCPPNAALTCDEYADDLAAALLACEDAADEDACQSAELTAAGYGDVTAIDNCSVTTTPTVTVTIDQCGAGSVVRSFSGVDPSGNASNVCTQVITVTHVSDWVVEFPEDQDGFCDQADPEFGEPEIFFETCELIATSFEDQFFDIVPDACFKIVRQWTVINWCVVGNVIDQESNAVELSEQQLNEDLDGDGDRDDRTFRDSYRGVLPTSDNDPDADNQDGFITYQQVIKVQDFDAPVIDPTFSVDDLCIITGNDGTDDDFSDCAFSGVLPTPDYTDCTLDVNGNLDNNGNIVDNELTITATVFDANGDVVSNSVVVNDLEIGCYVVRYVAIDRCGNTVATDYDFCVNDCKFPTPYCKDGVVLELMHINDPNNTTFEPMVELWASDLDLGSYDNCPGGVKLSFSANVNDIGTTFNCDNLGENAVQMWVTDASGNQDFCETFVIIQANQGQCGTDPLVAANGAIANEANASVEDVTVEMSGQSNGMVTTDADGNFNFNVPTGSDVTITPSKDDNHSNGVSTFDLVVISKHILGTQTLDSPYKMIAADANNSQTISTLDLVQIRKLILLIDTEFANNTSWRFVDKDFTFANPTNPWATSFPEVVNINNIDADVLDADFVAIKIGDVNGSAATSNNLLGADDRSAGTMNINANDRMVKAGETFTVDFTTVEAVEGYQFTMNFNNALDFVALNEGTAKEENFGFAMLNERAITASYNGETTDETAFSMTFTANADIMLSEALNINSRYTAAEAYNTNNELLDVELNFNTAANATFELYQNTPNPFNGETTIGFNLATEGAATLTIADVSGRVLTVIEGNYAKGYNQVTVNNLPSVGVMYYTLATANETATKKMVATK
jgi:hypothetical protein